jgi:hypothetical protein
MRERYPAGGLVSLRAGISHIYPAVVLDGGTCGIEWLPFAGKGAAAPGRPEGEIHDGEQQARKKNRGGAF